MKYQFTIFLLSLYFSVSAQLKSDYFKAAEDNSRQTNEIILRMRRNMMAWLDNKDAETGLLPRVLTNKTITNYPNYGYTVRDCAADLYPFLVLTSYFTDKDLYEGYMHDFLRQEIKLTTGPDGLSRDAVFNPFTIKENNVDHNIFG